MSEQLIGQILVALPATILALAALLKIFKVHKEINSRLTEWKEESAKATIASNAASKAEGIKEEKARKS
jgi:hypothetical protein